MKILFTKTGIEQEVSEHLGTACAFDCKDFIRVENCKINPFSLDNHSLIFSSANAVKAFFENGFQPNAQNKLYVVGSKTRNAFLEKGFEKVEAFRNIHELSDFITEHLPKETFLHFCGNLTLDVLEKALPQQNIPYRKITVYNTHLLNPEISENYDAVVFFSPSGVRSFAAFNSLEGKRLFSIGQTTEKELRKYTQSLVFTSEENSLEDLLQLIQDRLKA